LPVQVCQHIIRQVTYDGEQKDQEYNLAKDAQEALIPPKGSARLTFT